ncbi:MAG: hypothetical protein ACRDVG_16285 [Jatrophihabitantaceae bacterium]
MQGGDQEWRDLRDEVVVVPIEMDVVALPARWLSRDHRHATHLVPSN